jgi:hypothetical protein
MASFLDNDGDIILDAVLTDYGRQLLAKGDGSFNITKFALGDDEIDYQLFDLTASVALQDTSIMSTPILEAFTNNAASMKSRLLTINIENLLYLPVVKANTILRPTGSFSNGFSGYVVPVIVTNATNTELESFKTNGAFAGGVLIGDKNTLAVDQGLDSPNTDKNTSLLVSNPELYEREYNVYLDYRLGQIQDQIPLSIDDDGIAVYRFTSDNSAYVTQIVSDDPSRPIAGNQGTRLQFTLQPKQILRDTNTYFDSLGNSAQSIIAGTTHKTIRSSISIEGITTGCSVEIPILYAKKE